MISDKKNVFIQDSLTKNLPVLPEQKLLAFNFTGMDQNTGKYIIVFGGLIILAGLIVYLFGDKLHWIGRLPGDIRVEKENFRFYFPITTMILFSLLLTVIVNLIRRIL
jgi:hypothetical protein